jgi:hypothetical protein
MFVVVALLVAITPQPPAPTQAQGPTNRPLGLLRVVLKKVGVGPKRSAFVFPIYRDPYQPPIQKFFEFFLDYST